jgi:hypothetical protein
MLARKGYPAGLAISTVKDALAARDSEAAEFAEQIDPDALAVEINESAETGEMDKIDETDGRRRGMGDI